MPRSVASCGRSYQEEKGASMALDARRPRIECPPEGKSTGRAPPSRRNDLADARKTSKAESRNLQPTHPTTLMHSGIFARHAILRRRGNPSSGRNFGTQEPRCVLSKLSPVPAAAGMVKAVGIPSVHHARGRATVDTLPAAEHRAPQPREFRAGHPPLRMLALTHTGMCRETRERQ